MGMAAEGLVSRWVFSTGCNRMTENNDVLEKLKKLVLSKPDRDELHILVIPQIQW